MLRYAYQFRKCAQKMYLWLVTAGFIVLLNTHYSPNKYMYTHIQAITTYVEVNSNPNSRDKMAGTHSFGVQSATITTNIRQKIYIYRRSDQ